MQKLSGPDFVAAVCKILPYTICDWSVVYCDSEYMEILEHNAAEHERKFGPNKLKIWKRMSKNRDHGYETDDEGVKEGEEEQNEDNSNNNCKKTKKLTKQRDWESV